MVLLVVVLVLGYFPRLLVYLLLASASTSWPLVVSRREYGLEKKGRKETAAMTTNFEFSLVYYY
jgi:hypothetical protein